AAARVQRILVLGGDGMVHEAANGVLRAGLADPPPLGVLPAGTGNDYAKLARTQGRSLAHAVQALRRGRVRRFDVGMAWNEFFLNSVGIGFDAAVAREVNRSRWGRGMPAYLAAVARVIRRFDAPELEIHSDGLQFRDRLLLLEVAIGPVVGGGFRLTPDAVPDDGLLDVCAVQALSVGGILVKLPLAVLGRHTGLRQVRMFRTTRLVVESRDAPLHAQFDGELRELSGRMEIHIVPGALPVLIAQS
ncbi:MAG TPA: diacylglycerol kinase family protein, partial [Gemmatimonadales bacterium]|nr:diacylglycerol kinase family protein [Gemmatimonadales bacterium]